MLLRFLSCLLFLATAAPLTAQNCDLLADAGPDGAFCPGGGQVSLSGTVDPPDATFRWEPTTGLADPNSLTTTATLTAPATYTLVVEYLDETNNLVLNGDFEQGEADWTTDYDPGSGGAFGLLSDEGEYAIATNSNQTHSNFGNCSDHTGGGNMLVINGATTLGENVFCTTVSVVAGTAYRFGVWLQSVEGTNPALLRFSIDGDDIGTTFQAGGVCDWREFTETIDAATTGEVEICITNQNTAGGGNDFAIDDVFFGAICRTEDEVNFTEIAITAAADNPVQIPCGNEATLELDGSGTSEGADYDYLWTSANGNVVSGETTLFPIVDEPGVYVLTVTYDDGTLTCSDQTFVVVQPAPSSVTALGTALGSISCASPTVTLTAAGSSSGPTIRYNWSTEDGTILSGTDDPTAEAAAPGTYFLTVYNDDGGCFEEAEVVVTGNLDGPEARIAVPAPLTCTGGDVTLDALNSDLYDGVSITWTTPDGNFTGGTTTLQPTVDQTGTYLLTLTDGGCRDTASVTVVADADLPVVTIAEPRVFGCTLTRQRLNATGSSSGPDFSAAWTTSDGNIVASANSQMVLVDSAGTYTLTVTNTANGCTAVDSVTVLTDRSAPELAITNPPVFTCDRAQMTLDAAAGPPDSTLVYAWQTTDGNLMSPSDSSRVLIDRPGTYAVTITNAVNGCQSDTSLVVGENRIPPPADAGPDGLLTCLDTIQRVGAADADPAYVYAWRNDSTLIAGATSPRLDVFNPGNYVLTATDPANGCQATDTVTISSDDDLPVVIIGPAEQLTCTRDTLRLDGSATDLSDGGTLLWTTADGTTVGSPTGPTLRVTAPGTYVLTYTAATGCPGSSSVIVTADRTPPVALALPAPQLTCTETQLRLSGEGSDTGPNLSYAWSTTDGNLLADTATLAPLVDDAGTYRLTVRNAANGCTAEALTVVAENRVFPPAEISGPDLLTCRDSVVELSTDPNPGAPYAYAWTIPGFPPTVLGQNANLNVTSAGTYLLTVRDTTNNCVTTESRTVTADQTRPSLAIAPFEPLNCAVRRLQFTVGPPAPGLVYLADWSTTNGTIVEDAYGALVEGPGDYRLQLTNPANGCTSERTVTVTENVTLPTASALAPEPLTCRQTTRRLDGTASSTGPNILYGWATEDGNITAGQFTPEPTVSAAGEYVLTVVDGANNCAHRDTVVVELLGDLPQLTAQLPAELTCSRTELTLNATAATGGDDFTVAWTTPNGNILNGGDQLQPTVDQPGDYQLLVVNVLTDCRDSVTLTVTQNIAPPEVTLASPVDLGCIVGAPVDLPASVVTTGDPTHAWSTTDGAISGPANGPTLTVTAPGTYALTVTDGANDCATVRNVVAEQRPLTDFRPTATDPTCRTDFGSLDFGTPTTGTPPYLYSRDGGTSFQATPPADSLLPGTYALRLQDANGCEQDTQLTILPAALLELALNDRTAVRLGDSLLLDVRSNFADAEIASVTWTPATGLSCADCLRPRAAPTATTTYRVDIISRDGCVATDSVTLVLDDLTGIYFPTAFSPNGDGTNDRYHPFADLRQIVAVRDFTIFDRWGEIVHQQQDFLPNDAAAGWDGTLNGRPLNPNVFVYSATVELTGGRRVTLKGDFTLLR